MNTTLVSLTARPAADVADDVWHDGTRILPGDQWRAGYRFRVSRARTVGADEGWPTHTWDVHVHDPDTGAFICTLARGVAYSWREAIAHAARDIRFLLMQEN